MFCGVQTGEHKITQQMLQDLMKKSRGDPEAINDAVTKLSQETSMQGEQIASLQGLIIQVGVCAQASLSLSAFMSVF